MATGDGFEGECSAPEQEPEQEAPPRPIVVRPAAPLAMRVNRNVLVVAAVIMAVTVVTAVMLLNPQGAKGGSATSRQETATPMTAGVSTPSFLERPLAGPTGPSGTTAGDSAKERQRSESALQKPDTARLGGKPLSPIASDPYVMTPPMPAPQSSGPSSVQTLREEALTKALVSRPAVEIGAVKALEPDSTGDSDSLIRLPQAESSRQSYQKFLSGTHMTAGNGHAAPTGVTALRSPYVVQAGSVIPGLLVTGINSDLPGQILAQVSRDVYDSPTEQVLLIPRGSKLLATYDNEVLTGQNRVLIAFTRIIFPDGRSVALPGLGATDRQGEAGLSDQVDNHLRHTFGSAVLLSLISAAVQLSQPRTGSSVFAPANPGQVAAGAVGQELGDVASQMMRRNLDVVPTLVIRPGTPCNVFLANDLVFAGPYVDERVAR